MYTIFYNYFGIINSFKSFSLQYIKGRLAFTARDLLLYNNGDITKKREFPLCLFAVEVLRKPMHSNKHIEIHVVYIVYEYTPEDIYHLLVSKCILKFLRFQQSITSVSKRLLRLIHTYLSHQYVFEIRIRSEFRRDISLPLTQRGFHFSPENSNDFSRCKVTNNF